MCVCNDEQIRITGTTVEWDEMRCELLSCVPDHMTTHDVSSLTLLCPLHSRRPSPAARAVRGHLPHADEPAPVCIASPRTSVRCSSCARLSCVVASQASPRSGCPARHRHDDRERRTSPAIARTCAPRRNLHVRLSAQFYATEAGRAHFSDQLTSIRYCVQEVTFCPNQSPEQMSIGSPLTELAARRVRRPATSTAFSAI